jgi:hypothetical protein
MAQRLEALQISVRDIDATNLATAQSYDLGVWAAGYERRAGFLVQSEFKPSHVDTWRRVEFAEDRNILSARLNRKIDCGTVLGGKPGKRNRDGYWTELWFSEIKRLFRKKKRPVDIFVDYSSMSRAAYGSLLVGCLSELRGKVRSVTLAYVPGDYAGAMDGTHTLTGLRGLIGTEGTAGQHGATAFLFGLGYDGALADGIIDLFQVGHYSCLYANPGVANESVDLVVKANRSVINRSEVVATASACSISEAMSAISQLAAWYTDRYDVLLVPIGPKPHVVASILATMSDPRIGFRFPLFSRVKAVDVEAKQGTKPFVTRLEF